MINKYLLKGLISYIPLISRFYQKKTGGSSSARYCYSVWLRHLVKLYEKKQKIKYNLITELGPGDSLGLGIAALLSGFENYEAIDVYKFSNVKKNLEILKEITYLFKNKSSIPGDDEFPRVHPKLNSYAFPNHIFRNKLNDNIISKKTEKIKESIINIKNTKTKIINYNSRFKNSSELIYKKKSDLIISQAVMEHSNNIEETYKFMSKKISHKGIISNVVDFKSHGTSKIWNGHWCYEPLTWKIIAGSRSYFLNREPLSSHIFYLDKYKFKIFNCVKEISKNNISKKSLAVNFRELSQEDLHTSAALIQASPKKK